MEKDTFYKYRAMFVFVIMVMLYPLLLMFAVLCKCYQFVFKKSECKNVSGDVAVITGAAHGLGKEIAIALAKRGCHVAIVDINIELAESTAKYIMETFNVKTKAYKVDVSSFEQVAALNENVTKDLGAASILVNNAGMMVFSNIKEPDWREVQRMINVNLTAHFWTNRIFLPKMKESKRGHIIAISSLSSMLPLMYNAEYTSTKFAVRGLMRVLREELLIEKFKNINATTVFPTFLQTNQDVADLVQQTGLLCLFPLISGTEVAERIVYGMLRNEEEIVIPEFAGLLYRMLELLPASWQTQFICVISHICDLSLYI